MKKLTLLTLILVFSNCLHSQGWWNWTDPVALTDSISDNLNPYLFYDGVFHMVWEKPVDSTTTSIWYQDITTKTPPVEILHTSGVHYKHPKIMNTLSSSFYVFYETNENGNIDIYYMSYQGNASFSDPLAFANTQDDETDVEINYHNQAWDARNDLVWLRDSSVYHCYLGDDFTFTEPVLIDSANCSNPVISSGGYHIIWEKGTPFGKHLMYSKDINNGGWTDPEVMFDEYPCMNLKSDKFMRDLITWSVFQDSVWKIAAGDPQGSYIDYEIFDITSETPFEPAITFYFTPLEDLYELYLAFPYDVDGQNELYMNKDAWLYHQFENFTNSQTNNRNPDFFFGPDDYSYCDGIYLVWESYNNNHWQIFYSEAPQCWGAIGENDDEESLFNIYPNPASDLINIRSEENIDHLRVINMNGKVCYENYPGKERVNIPISGFMDGVYVVELIVEDKVSREKIVIKK